MGGKIVTQTDAPPVSKPSLVGTPYADFNQNSPGLAAKKPVTKYKNGKLVEDNSLPVLEIISEFGDDRSGKLVVSAFQGDVLYMGVTVTSEAGTPRKDLPVAVLASSGNSVVLMKDATDKDGYLEFHVLANRPGHDTVSVTAAGVERKFILDVRQPTPGDWLGDLDTRGATPWSLLMSAAVSLQRDVVEARFTADLNKLRDQTVKLAGFMLPLESSEKQKHFLLSANPPACFFHPPGGPSSVVEVFAEKGVPISFDPMVIEGRLELVERSEAGVLYKLHAARKVSGGG